MEPRESIVRIETGRIEEVQYGLAFIDTLLGPLAPRPVTVIPPRQEAKQGHLRLVAAAPEAAQPVSLAESTEPTAVDNITYLDSLRTPTPVEPSVADASTNVDVAQERIRAIFEDAA